MALADGLLRVELAFSPAPRQVLTARVALPEGSTLVDALRVSGWLELHALALDSVSCGVWGKVQAMDWALRDGDRVEVYRSLRVDPKEARRLRYRKQQRA